LDLTFCKIGDVTAQEFARLNSLESVLLARTGITDIGLAALSSSPKLRKLRVNSTKINGAGIRSISQLQNLECLDLDNTGVDDPAVTYLVGFRNLRELYLSATRITDNG